MPSPYKAQPGVTKIKPYNTFPSPVYSHVTASQPGSKIVATAGQVGRDVEGNVPSDPEEQIALAFYNLQQCLEAVGAKVEDVLKLTYYIVNYDSKNRRHTKHLLKFLGSHRPAITSIPVVALADPQFLFEIEATAAIPQEPLREVDVVVVGGGLSGLKAAWDLQKAGFSCVVLEARDRVGGKTWSQDSQTGKVDVGAAWINDSNQSYMFELAERFNLETVVQNIDGKMTIENGGIYQTAPYGGVLEDRDWAENVVEVRMLLEDLCQKIDIRKPVASGLSIGKDFDSVTLEEFAKSVNYSEHALNMVKISTRALLGVEPSEMSALYLLDYCKSAGGLLLMRGDGKHGGQYLRIASGTQSFSKCIAEELTAGSVILNSPVRYIRQTENEAFIESARGSFRCKRVVISVPTPLYKEIAFDPPLPEGKVKLSENTQLGFYAKSIAVYNRPWWRETGMCGLLQSYAGPAAVTRDTSVESCDHFSLTCFLVGEPGRQWSKLSKPGRDKAVLDQIERGFGKFARVEQPMEIVEHRWIRDQWSQGCPCPVMPPGILTNYGHALRAPFGRLHFVGTETGYEWKGYMEGAVRSGERGAQEVVQKLTASRL